MINVDTSVKKIKAMIKVIFGLCYHNDLRARSHRVIAITTAIATLLFLWCFPLLNVHILCKCYEPNFSDIALAIVITVCEGALRGMVLAKWQHINYLYPLNKHINKCGFVVLLHAFLLLIINIAKWYICSIILNNGVSGGKSWTSSSLSFCYTAVIL